MDIRAIFLGVIFVIMWASAFTVTRVIVADAPAVMALAIRFLISGALGVGIAFAMGQKIALDRAGWRAVVIFGICQNALYLGLNWYAMQTVEAGLASIIASTMPLVVAVMGRAVFGDRLSGLAATGLVVGFLGVALIMGSRISGGVDVYGVILCVLGAIALAVATLAVRGASMGGNLLMVVGLQMLVGGVTLIPYVLVFESWEVTWSLGFVAAFFYAVLVPGLLATLVWFALVGRIGAVRAATYHFLTPFFGVAIAAVMLGEKLRLLDIIGVGIVMLGILAVQLSKQR